MRRSIALVLQHREKLLRQLLALHHSSSRSQSSRNGLVFAHQLPTHNSNGPSLPSRMMLPMHLLQMLHRHMRIHLRRRNIRMPQQPLHAAQVCAMLHHVRRAAVPQHMRTRLAATPIRSREAARTISHTHCRVRGRPRTLRNSALRKLPAPANPPRANTGRPRFRYSSSASTALRPSGTIRSLSPLPRTCARACSRCRSSSPSATISPTRSPPA